MQPWLQRAKASPWLVVLCLLTLTMQYQLFFGSKNMFSVMRLKSTWVQQRHLNDQQRAHNAHLLAEVVELKGASGAIEERARQELRMIKPGETYYRISSPSHQSA